MNKKQGGIVPSRPNIESPAVYVPLEGSVSVAFGSDALFHEITTENLNLAAQTTTLNEDMTIKGEITIGLDKAMQPEHGIYQHYWAARKWFKICQYLKKGHTPKRAHQKACREDETISNFNSACSYCDEQIKKTLFRIVICNGCPLFKAGHGCKSFHSWFYYAIHGTQKQAYRAAYKLYSFAKREYKKARAENDS